MLVSGIKKVIQLYIHLYPGFLDATYFGFLIKHKLSYIINLKIHKTNVHTINIEKISVSGLMLFRPELFQGQVHGLVSIQISLLIDYPCGILDTTGQTSTSD